MTLIFQIDEISKNNEKNNEKHIQHNTEDETKLTNVFTDFDFQMNIFILRKIRKKRHVPELNVCGCQQCGLRDVIVRNA